MHPELTQLQSMALSPNEEDRLNAIEAMIACHDIRVVPILEKMAALDTSLHVRYMAQRSIFLLKGLSSNSINDATAADSSGTDEATDDANTESPGQGAGKGSPPAGQLRVPRIKLPKYKAAYSAGGPEKRVQLLQAAVRFRAVETLPFLCEQAGREKFPEVRRLLPVALGILGDKPEMKLVSSFLQDSDPKVRAAAIDGLEYIGHGSVYPVIIRFLSDEDQEIRLKVVKALKGCGKQTLMNILEQMIESKKFWMRDSAAYALSVFASDSLLPIIEKGISDPDREVRSKIRAALERLAARGNSRAKDLLKTFSNQTMAWQDSSVDFLAGLEITSDNDDDPLSSPDARQRIKEIDRIISQKDAGRIPALCRRLETEEDIRVRARMINAIGHVGSQNAAKYVIRQLDDPTPRIRATAVEAIATLLPDRMPEEIEALLFDDDPDVRSRAIVALKDSRSLLAVKALQKMAEHPIPSFRRAAFFAVTVIKDERIIPILIQFLDDETERLRDRAIEFIQRLRLERNSLYETLLRHLQPHQRDLIEGPVSTADALKSFSKELKDLLKKP